MKNPMSKTYYIYALFALAIFVIGVFILQEPLPILFFSFAVLVFIGTAIALIKKVGVLQQENEINIERFAISLEHVSNVLFDNVLEADITNDRLIGDNTKKLARLLGMPNETSYNKTLAAVAEKMVHKDFSEEYYRILSSENILRTLEQGMNTLEYECIERSDGENYRWIRVHYCIYSSKATNCVKVISYVKNIDAEKRAYDRLIEKAKIDLMTGVLNKISTKEVVVDTLKRYKNESHAILMIDIDDFKKVNDRYGHDVGDEVIISVCNVIKHTFRETDIVGRIGGDEFLVCMREDLSHDYIETRVAHLVSEVKALTVELSGIVVNDITVSIGIVNTFGNENFEQLYHYADSAMYKAKSMGKNQYFVYDYKD